MNLKPKEKFIWHELIDRKFVAVYIALALVLVINQVVFSVLLPDREKAEAFDNSIFSTGVTNLGSQTVTAGSNDVLLAEFFLPDPLFMNENTVCNGSYAGNPCMTLIDTNGAADNTAGGADDDNISYMWQAEPHGQFLRNYVRKADKICYDFIDTPSCIYYDPDFSPADSNEGVQEPCPAIGVNEVYLLDVGGTTCATATTYAGGISNTTTWLHNEIKNTDDISNYSYDYCGGPTELGCGANDFNASGTILFENGGVCGTANLSWEADQEAIWDDSASLDGVWTPGVDIIYWDPATCLTGSGACAVGCAGTAIAGGGSTNPYFLNDGTTCGTANTSDGIWQYPEPFWNDLPSGNDGTFITGSGDQIYWDPLNCLQDGTSSGVRMLTPEQLTETLRIYNGTIDTQIQAEVSSASCALVRDNPVDCDGSATTLISNCDQISGGDTLIPLTGAENLCTEDLQIASRIFIHSGYTIKCDSTQGMSLDLRVSSGPGLYTDVGTNWSYKESNGIPGWQNGEDLYNNQYNNPTYSPGSVYDIGYPNMLQGVAYPIWPANAAYFDADSSGAFDSGEVAVLDLNTNGTYELGVDTDVHSLGLADGVTLTSFTGAVGVTGSPVYYIDINQNSTFDCGDSIFEDNGNMQTGTIDNGYVDAGIAGVNLGDLYNAMSLKNAGTANLGTDITNIRVYSDFWYLDGFFGYDSDGRCIGPAGTGDLYASKLILDSSNNLVPTDVDTTLGMNKNVMPFHRVCIVGDITSSAINNRTIKLQVPQLSDGGTSGVYNPGDQGLFFYSLNDGPTDAAFDFPYTVTISSSNPEPAIGGLIPDVTTPGDVTNLKIDADAQGKVTMSWVDPVDSDLKEIVIRETSAAQTDSIIVNKGVQTATLYNLIIGRTYTFIVKARDINGLESQGVSQTIIIPLQGETSESTVPIELPIGVTSGELVKDSSSSAVYYIGPDNRKHVFINEEIYKTWYSDFSEVNIISVSTLALVVTGKEVRFREGTYLLKKAGDIKVYALLPGGNLSWIKNESIATALYGTAWAKKVLEIPSAMFSLYTISSKDIESAVHPDGSLIMYPNNAAVFYIENGSKHYISAQIWSQSRFQDRFISKNIDSALTYPAGPALAAMTQVRYWE